jgi:hypothetical protein
MNRASFASTILIASLPVLFSACVTYNVRKLPDPQEGSTTRKESVVAVETAELHCVSLSGKQDSRDYLGLDPASSNMVPVLLRIENHGRFPVKVDLSRTFLTLTMGENRRSLTLEESCDRARRADAAPVLGAAIMFGLIGAAAGGAQAASANRSLEEDYFQKYFRPTLINSEASGRGVVFFDVPADKQSAITLLTVTLVDVSTGAPTPVTMDFPR